ncbi:MAG TPA: serine hydrolase domain-containing protein [Pyrinomonadaceae bacterium]|nr:serine hydrolase domain-containing protein [Pyrinomonadaceae bacterium]
MRIFTRTVVVLLFVWAAHAQDPARTKIQGQLDEWHKAGKFAGATLGVCRNGTDCFSLAVGYSDLESKTPMRPSDVMLAGSVGKTFAAAIALQLVADGKIELDTQIERYLGTEKWFDRLPNARSITVRQLMNHTSGLVRYEFNDKFLADLKASPDKVWRPEELIAYLFDSKAPFEAGKGWDYSDTNYIVLGMIIEKVTGKRYYDLARKQLLKRLKLKLTFPQDKRRLKGLVQGYAGEGNEFTGSDKVISNGTFAINPQFEWTGGGMVSNSGDLARWAADFYEGRAFDNKMLPQALDPVSAPMLGREAKYGLGVIIRPTAVGISYGHSGFFPGYMTEMMYFPEHRLALALQVNSSVPRNLGKSPARVLVEAAQTLIGKKQ